MRENWEDDWKQKQGEGFEKKRSASKVGPGGKSWGGVATVSYL